MVVGGIIALDGAGSVSRRLLLAGLSAALVAGGGNAVNDAFDTAIDRINRPNRPIPEGLITPLTAHLAGLMLMVIGVALGFSLGFKMGIIALCVSLLLGLYSALLKRTPGFGNLAVALCGGLAFIYGAVAVDKLTGGVVPALFALLIHLGREIVKDAEDEAGDRSAGVRTIPVVMDTEAAQRIAAAVLVLLVLMTPIPYILNIYNCTYLILVIALVDIPLLFSTIRLLKRIDRPGLSRISLVLKLTMITGLISLYAG